MTCGGRSTWRWHARRRDVGFDSIWVGDHLLYRDDGRPERGPWEAWTLLAGARRGDRARPARSAGRLRRVPSPGAPGQDGRDRGRGERRALVVGDRCRLEPGGVRRVRRSVRPSRIAVRGSVRDRAAPPGGRARDVPRRVSAGVDDAVLLPEPARRPPLMIGSRGERVLSIALPHVDAWNTWFDWYGNTPKDSPRGTPRSTPQRCAPGVTPRDRAERVRPVVLDRGGGRAADRSGCPPLEGTPERIADGTAEMAEAGADEVIVVVGPIDEAFDPPSSAPSWPSLPGRDRLASAASEAAAMRPRAMGVWLQTALNAHTFESDGETAARGGHPALRVGGVRRHRDHRPLDAHTVPSTEHLVVITGAELAVDPLGAGPLHGDPRDRDRRSCRMIPAGTARSGNRSTTTSSERSPTSPRRPAFVNGRG